MSNGSVYLSAQVRREVGLYGQQRGEAIMWSNISILYGLTPTNEDLQTLATTAGVMVGGRSYRTSTMFAMLLGKVGVNEIFGTRRIPRRVRSAHVREGQHRGGATSRASYGRYGDDAVTGGTDKRMYSRESSFNVGPTSAT